MMAQLTAQRRGAAVEIAGLRREYASAQGAVVALDNVDLQRRARRVRLHRRPERLRKVDAAAHPRRPRPADAPARIRVDAEGWAVQNAMVFQESGLFPWMSVETNVRFGLIPAACRRPRPIRASRRRSSSSASPSSAATIRTSSPAACASARAIARAFVTDPAMLLMDEPFAALDAQNRVILQAELVRLWEQTGKTVIYVTHSIEEALLLGDRTVVMTAQPGRIKQIIDVPFPHPRDLMTLSASAEFGALKLDIWRVLEEEVMRARAEAER